MAPAMAWAGAHLELIATAAAGAAMGEQSAAVAGESVEVDGDGGEKVAWEAQMGLHHVVEVGQRIVEFCAESE